ncbi:MAG: Na+/H+ antiporter subunit E [Gordonia sp. (in: high G+C Gram-positive bacteria)]
MWRRAVVGFAWPTTIAIVWLHNHVRIPRFLGSDLRDFAVRLWALSWLTFVWVLLWGHVSWANVIIGVLVGLLVLNVLPLPRVPVEGRIHPIAALGLLVNLIAEFFVASAQVAWAAIRPGAPPLGAVLRVPVAIKSDLVLTLAVDYLNLVPGTIVVEIDHLRRMLYIHVFDVSSPKQIEKFYTQVERVERLFIRTFERDSEWHPSPYHGIDDDYHHVPFSERQRVAADREESES